ncbi:MAG: metal-dependent transcriptional regulator [Candidatus Bipolaricaulota bacterium]
MTAQTTEDYLEAIYKILAHKNRARTNDIASRLGVKPSSVTEMLGKLREKGYINYEKYVGATLTDDGREVAKNVSEIHENARKFLELLQVPPNQADEDACKIEHNLSEVSIDQLNKFINFVEGCPQGDAEWVKHFRYYSETSEFPPECDQESEGEKDMITTTEKKLSELEYGQTGVIKKIEKDLKDGMLGRGIREGKELKMETRQPIDGPVVFTVDRSMTSLGLKLARKIFVEVKEGK